MPKKQISGSQRGKRPDKGGTGHPSTAIAVGARALPWAVLCGALTVAGSAYGQTGNGGAAGASTANDSDSLGEVVVTANRVAQDIQKVGAAVQVVSGDSLAQQSLTNIGSIFADTPSVNITAQPAGFSINVRGQMSDGPSGNQEGAVATEFDGIYNIESLATAVGFFDMDRMEVLPGPQSTQYGPNADGGVINAISKDPVFNSYTGNGTVTYGNYNLRRVELGQNIPLGDTLAIRVAGAMIDRGSYTEPETVNAIDQSGRVKILWQPSDSFSLKAWFEMDHEGGTGNGLEPYIFNVVPTYNNGSINTPSYACNPANDPQYKGEDCGNPWNHPNTFANGQAETGHSDLYMRTYAATLSWKPNDSIVIDATPSYIDGNGQQTGNIPNGPPFTSPGTQAYSGTYTYNIQNPFEPFHEFATEIRVHNAPASKILWAVGYYLWQYTVDQVDFPPGGGPGNAYQVGPEYGHYNGVTTNAVFGDITYPLTDSFRVIAGARESGDVRESHQTLGQNNISVGTGDYNHFDFRLGEQKDLGDNAMEYLTYTTGYRPGQLSYQGNTNSWVTGPDEVNDATELGLKSRWLDNRLQLNGDVFYYFEANYQNGDNYTQYLPQGYEGITTTTGSQNICYAPNGGAQPPAVCNLPIWDPDVRAYGFETQIKFEPTPDDRFSLTGTFEKSTFQKNKSGCATVDDTLPASDCAIGNNEPAAGSPGNGFVNDLVFTNIQGETTAHTPTWSGNFGYDHIFRYAGYSLDVGGTAFYSDWYFAHPQDLPPAPDTQPAYWLFNVNVNLAPDNSFWAVNAYIRNLTNYAVKESYLPSTTLGDPRTYGVTLSLKW